MSLESNDYLAQVRKDRFKGFGALGVLGAADDFSSSSAVPPRLGSDVKQSADISSSSNNNTATSSSKALLAKFFSNSLQSVTLGKPFLPRTEQVTSTLQLFGKERQELLRWKEALAEEVELAGATTEETVVGKKRPASAEGTMQQLLRIQYQNSHLRDLPTGAEIRTWRRWVNREVCGKSSSSSSCPSTDNTTVAPSAKRLQPRLSIFLALDVCEMTALLHAVCHLLLGRATGGGGGGGGPREDAEEEKESAGNVSEDDEDEDEEEEEEEGCFLPAGQREALSLVGRLCGSTVASGGLGDWVYAVLVAADLPMESSTEQLLQDVLREVCKAVRNIGEARGVGRAVHQASSSIADQGAAQPAAFWEMEEVDATTTGTTPTSCFLPSYTNCGQIGKPEMAALHTLIILIGKFFRQGDPKKLPLI